MTDASPTPPNRQDPHLDPADDSDEPAFDWMKPASPAKGTDAAAGTPDRALRDEAALDEAPRDEAAEALRDEAALDEAPRAEPAETLREEPAAGPDQGAVSSAVYQPGRRADRTAEEDAVGPSRRGHDAVFHEPLPTSALQVRPPQADVERRNAERELAARAKPVTPRVMQVLLAVFYPVILLVLAVRVVASPLFLWVEYNRPGFPGDGYGFNTDDRMTYGSYAVDYLSNWSGPRYLGELVNRSGDKLFKDGEVSHMADVKLVILSTFGAGALLILLSLAAVLYLRRRGTGGVRRGLFAGSVITLVVIIGLGVLATLGWEQFFTEFHRVFFANGTWTFSLQDTLIRLFPGQFWVDSGIVIGALVLLASLVTLLLTWPTRKRRGLAKSAGGKGRSRKESKVTDGGSSPDGDPDGGADTDADPDGAADRDAGAGRSGGAGGAGGAAAHDAAAASPAAASAAAATPPDPARGHPSAL